MESVWEPADVPCKLFHPRHEFMGRSLQSLVPWRIKCSMIFHAIDQFSTLFNCLETLSDSSMGRHKPPAACWSHYQNPPYKDSSPLPGELSPMFVDGCDDSGYCHLDPPALAICSAVLIRIWAIVQNTVLDTGKVRDDWQRGRSQEILVKESGPVVWLMHSMMVACGNEARTGVLSSPVTIFLGQQSWGHSCLAWFNDTHLEIFTERSDLLNYLINPQ